MLYPPNSLILAPLSGFTDLPYRRAARACGCVYAFTEMVDVSSLAYAQKNSFKMLQRGTDESFLGVQLVGADVEHTVRAVEALNDYSVDVLDFNLGCPVPKVAKKGAGAVLGRNVSEALKLFEVIRKHSRFTLSAKIRIADEQDVRPTLDLVQGLAQLGAQAVTIHGRIKEKIYSGPVAFEQIRQCCELGVTQIVANGGVVGLESYEQIKQFSKCDTVMLARGAMGNPWLFRELIDQDKYLPPTIGELLETISRHIAGLCELYGEYSGMRMARKIVHDYLKGRGFGGEARAKASALCTLSEFNDFIEYLKTKHSGDSYWRMLEAKPNTERRLRRE